MPVEADQPLQVSENKVPEQSDFQLPPTREVAIKLPTTVPLRTVPVPSVAMKLSIWTSSTSRPLSRPSTQPIASTISTTPITRRCSPVVSTSSSTGALIDPLWQAWREPPRRGHSRREPLHGAQADDQQVRGDQIVEYPAGVVASGETTGEVDVDVCGMAVIRIRSSVSGGTASRISETR